MKKLTRLGCDMYSNMIFRSSEIHLLMGNAKSIDESLLNDDIKAIQAKTNAKRTQEEKDILSDLLQKTLSATAKTLIKDKVRKLVHNAPHKFSGSKETEKGNLVEEDAIRFLMQQEFISVSKNTTRFNNEWITGEPDIITSDRVLDTKCPWTYWSMPYFKDDVESKSLDAGYDWQQLCYLWLLRENDSHDPVIINEAQLKYVLMPTPDKLVNKWDDWELHIDFVEHMNPSDRISTYSIFWDAAKIELIKTKIEAARRYANSLELK